MQTARVQSSDKKEQVSKSFTEADGKLYLVIATAAFGMALITQTSGESCIGGYQNFGEVYTGKWLSRTRWRALCGSALLITIKNNNSTTTTCRR